MKTLKNKLYAVVLLICGYLPVLIDKDATALVFFLRLSQYRCSLQKKTGFIED